jgi:hypothetical protein
MANFGETGQLDPPNLALKNPFVVAIAIFLTRGAQCGSRLLAWQAASRTRQPPSDLMEMKLVPGIKGNMPTDKAVLGSRSR